jgi:hypothetical protein
MSDTGDYVNPDSPGVNAYHMAYAEAANLTDAQLGTALTDAADSVTYARRLLAIAFGRRTALRQVQLEREDRHRGTPLKGKTA